MRAIDWFLRFATAGTALALLVLPNTKATFLALWGLFLAVGLWAVMYPPGILGWAKTAHRELDPSNENLWPVVRFIGAGFIVMSVFALIAILVTGRWTSK